MANRFWVGGSANWDTSALSKWATTSGGAGGAAAPTAADDVFLDATSGSGTITLLAATTIQCRSLDCTGFTGTLSAAAGTAVLNIGDATAGAGNSALKFSTGVTVSLNLMTINFISTSATVQSIDMKGRNPLVNLTFNGTGSWQVINNTLNLQTGALTLTKGTLDFNGKTVNCGSFTSSNGNTRTLTMGSSTINVSGSSVAWTTATTSGLTITANTATITFTGAGATIATGMNYNGTSLSFTGSGTATVGASSTGFANITRTGTATQDALLAFNGNTTITGTLTVNGAGATTRLGVASSTSTARSISAAAVVASYADFSGILAGGAANWNLSAITGGAGDALGNTGITFTTAAQQTWQGTSGGNWSDVTKWTSRIPLPQDNIVIASAFSASQTITMDVARLGKDINWTGSTGSPKWSGTANLVTTMYGDLNLTGMSTTTSQSGNSFQVSGRGTQKLTAGGATFTIPFVVNSAQGVGGTYTHQDAWQQTANSFTVTNGSWSTGNQPFTRGATGGSGGLIVSSGTTADFGTSTVTLAGTATSTPLSLSAGATVTADQATFVISTVSSSVRTIAMGGQNLGTLTYTVAGSTGSLAVTGSGTIGTLNFSDASNARTLTLPSSTTITIGNAFNVNGTAGKLMSVVSSTAGTAATLSKASGVVASDYLSLQDSTATGGAAFYAGFHSTNVSNNTGWDFHNAPTAGSVSGAVATANAASPTGSLTAATVLAGGVVTAASTTPTGSLSTATVLTGGASAATSTTQAGSLSTAATVAANVANVASAASSGAGMSAHTLLIGAQGQVTVVLPGGPITGADEVSGMPTGVLCASPAGVPLAAALVVAGVPDVPTTMCAPLLDVMAALGGASSDVAVAVFGDRAQRLSYLQGQGWAVDQDAGLFASDDGVFITNDLSMG